MLWRLQCHTWQCWCLSLTRPFSSVRRRVGTAPPEWSLLALSPSHTITTCTDESVTRQYVIFFNDNRILVEMFSVKIWQFRIQHRHQLWQQQGLYHYLPQVISTGRCQRIWPAYTVIGWLTKTRTDALLWLVLVPELTPVYLLKVTGSFMGISEKGIPLGIWNSTAGEPQPRHKVRINPFSRFRRNQKYGKLMR